MHSVYDVDVTLLLATMLAAKRRPAALDEIVAAAELAQGLQGTLPGTAKLKAAFSRLATHGLVRAADTGFALTAAGEEIVAGIARKATMAERLAEIRERLGAYTPTDGNADIVIDDAAWQAAIAAHRASADGAGRNLLVPKPKSEVDERKRPGERRGPRRAAPPRRRPG